MRVSHFYFILMTAFLFSCESSPLDYTALNRSIEVSAHIEGVKTRASNNTWDAGDVIGIYMKTAGEELSAESALYKNAKYTTSGDGNFTPQTLANNVKLPLDGSSVDFISYYPQGTVNAAFEYNVDVKDQSSQAAIDLMYSDNATGLNKESPAVNLSFSHQLSKILVNLNTTGEKLLDDVTITIKGMNTKGKFSLIDKSLTGSSKSNIAMLISNDFTTAEAIVLPVETLSGITFEITSELDGYTYTLSDAVNITEFEPGYKYSFTLTLDTRAAVSAIATIEDWTTGPSESSIIDKTFDVYIPVGDGTEENPFTIEDAMNLTDLSGVWVQGYIVGYYSGTTPSSLTDDVNDPETKTTHLAIAATANETSGVNTVSVQLPTGNIRESLNLKDNPDNLGKEVMIKGTLASYLGTSGVNPTSDFQFVNP